VNRAINFLLWLLRIAIFIVLFGLAIKNGSPMELRFFFEQSWQLPVSVVVLASFAIGVLVGLTAIAGHAAQRRRRDGH
jgi:lipopolysaccharide assembly protein A